MGYGKAFPEMFTGSMMGAGGTVFAVWAYAITNVGKSGHVELNPRLLATMIGEPEAKIRDAITYLSNPDPNSRSKEQEGRRIIRTGEFEYFMVNYKLYDGIRTDEERRQYKREWDQENRPSGHKRDTSREPIIAAIVERDGKRCGICGKHLDLKGCHIDHILPRCKDGTDSIDNLQLAHSKCNKGKSGGDTYLADRHSTMPNIQSDQSDQSEVSPTSPTSPTPSTSASASASASVKKKDKEIKRKEKRKAATTATKYPTAKEVTAYAWEKGYDFDGKTFVEYYEAGGWKDSKGNPVRNWKQKFLAVWAPKLNPYDPNDEYEYEPPDAFERAGLSRKLTEEEADAMYERMYGSKL